MCGGRRGPLWTLAPAGCGGLIRRQQKKSPAFLSLHLELFTAGPHTPQGLSEAPLPPAGCDTDQDLDFLTFDVDGLSSKLSNRMSLSMCSARGSCSWSWENSISKIAGGDTSSSRNMMFSAWEMSTIPLVSSSPHVELASTPQTRVCEGRRLEGAGAADTPSHSTASYPVPGVGPHCHGNPSILADRPLVAHC